MPELHELAEKLRGQLDDLKVPSRLIPQGDAAEVRLEIQLSAETAEILSWALENHAHSELSEAEEKWEAVSAATSQIEGFTGGEASE